MHFPCAFWFRSTAALFEKFQRAPQKADSEQIPQRCPRKRALIIDPGYAAKFVTHGTRRSAPFFGAPSPSDLQGESEVAVRISHLGRLRPKPHGPVVVTGAGAYISGVTAADACLVREPGEGTQRPCTRGHAVPDQRSSGCAPPCPQL